MANLPRISVVISTRNRGTSILSTILSILANDHPAFEIWIIDQSPNLDTREVLQPILANRRVHYVHAPTNRGLAAGRNLGITRARSDIVAITDDDCEVPPHWLRSIVDAFALDRRVGVVFGNVLAVAHDAATGFIPTYERKAPFLARGIRHKNKVRGIGACLALRKTVWEAVHGFDPRLGVGAAFRACEDGDLAVKVLLAGYAIYETPEVYVVHNGFRTWEQGRDLAARNWYGVGAAYIKHVKCGHWSILPVIAYEWGRVAFGGFLHTALTKRRIGNVRPVVAFGQGLVAGLFTPVDRGAGNYALSAIDTVAAPGHVRVDA